MNGNTKVGFEQDEFETDSHIYLDQEIDEIVHYNHDRWFVEDVSPGGAITGYALESIHVVVKKTPRGRIYLDVGVGCRVEGEDPYNVDFVWYPGLTNAPLVKRKDAREDTFYRVVDLTINDDIPVRFNITEKGRMCFNKVNNQALRSDYWLFHEHLRLTVSEDGSMVNVRDCFDVYACDDWDKSGPSAGSSIAFEETFNINLDPWVRTTGQETDSQVWADHYEEVGIRETPAMTTSTHILDTGHEYDIALTILDVISYVPEANLVHAFQIVEGVDVHTDFLGNSDERYGTMLMEDDVFSPTYGGMPFNPTIIYRLRDGSLWEEVAPGPDLQVTTQQDPTWHLPHGCTDCGNFNAVPSKPQTCLTCMWVDGQKDPTNWIPREETPDLPDGPLGNGLAPSGYQERTIKRLCANDLRRP